MRKKKCLILVIIAFCAVSSNAQKNFKRAPAPVFTSVYSDMSKGKSCQTVEEEIIGCRPIGGYRIFAAFHNVFESVWIETLRGKTVADIPSDKTGGISRSLGKFEWRLANGKPFAVIARFGFYPMDEADQTGANMWSDKRKFAELLVVKGLPGYEQIDVELDARLTPDPNQKARDLADEAFMIKKGPKRIAVKKDISPENEVSPRLLLASPRTMIASQPDFTAQMSCVKYEKTFGHGYGESFKLVKKGDFYRHETNNYVDYFSPNLPPARYTLKTKKFELFAGDLENHIWFESLESSALLARDDNLKFEMVGSETGEFEVNGRTQKLELIKIKATGETEVGGDFDRAQAFLYLAPDLRGVVVKTELILPNAGRKCSLQNISFTASSNELFREFTIYRNRQIDKSKSSEK